jgi:hypothetical protein
MKNCTFVFALIILLVSSCGLNYTPTETREDLAVNRKTQVEQYIRDSYKDSSVVYQPILYGSPTLIKPYHHRLLDSLYEVKFTNEQAGRFDKELEEKINNQKIVIANSNEKIQYIEHHVYSIQTEGISNVYYADITFDAKSNVKQFQITEDYQFPSNLLNTFKSYLTRESIVYPNYGPTNDETVFYDLFDNELQNRPFSQKNEFMTHMLTTFLLARNIRSLETKLLLQHYSVIQVENRQYGSQVDVFHSINEVWENDILLGYEVHFTTPAGTFKGEFSPFLELKKMTKVV